MRIRGLPSTLRTPRLPAMGAWGVLPRVIEIGIGVVLLLAVGTEVVTAAVGGATFVQYLPVAVLVAGVAGSYRSRYLALVLVAVSPGVAMLVDRLPTGIWSMACFAALLFTLRGLSALVTGAVVAAGNFTAVAWYVGTVNVMIDSSASIAAFAAFLCAATGSALRSNYRYRVEAEQRVRDVEASRVAAVERGLAQERLRIARDLHDSVGHQIAVVNMRLGAAEVHLPDVAESSRADLAAAREAVQAVLRETQQILAVLRVGNVDTGLEATPDHSALPHLINSYRDAGMRIDATVDDIDQTLSPPVSAAVYRIVQEALTNAHKHGDRTTSLTIHQHRDGTVTIETVNLRRDTALNTSVGGNGLVGMRERAASVGGTLTTRADDRLFWLTATIPTAPATATKDHP